MASKARSMLKSSGAKSSGADARAARRAKALRDNLTRRKAQARGRSAAVPSTGKDVRDG